MSLLFLLEKLIFRPVKLNTDHPFQFPLEYEEINFYPQPQITINALHFKVKNPKGIILYFHGNKDNLARWGTIASEFSKYQYDVIAFDYRGYGKSTGKPTEENLFNDALFCYHQIMERITPENVILFGRSLGTGIASWLAAQVNPSKLILETPYYDMHDLVNKFIPSYFLKNIFYLKFSSYSYLKHSRFPILILHGTKDTVVPYKSGQKLFESIQNPNKQMVTFYGGKHNNLSSYSNYWLELKKFLE